MKISPARSPKITALICTLNEEPNLPYVLPRIPDLVSEVLVIDGHSTDRTVEVARKIRPDIRILGQPGRGKGDALKYGIEIAAGDIIVTLDADGSTDPADIPRFIGPLLDGHDFVKGSRLDRRYPSSMRWHRWLGNKVLVTAFNILFGTGYTDICSGYNAFWKTAFRHLSPSRDGFEMEQQILAKAKKAGLKVVEVGHYDKGRLGNASKVSALRQGLRDLMVIISERFHE
jgi:glycosyltransferase involved in cell wall biosynthesis